MSALTATFPRRVHFQLFALGFVAFAVHGSFVPFNFHAPPPATAWARFGDILRMPCQIGSRTDWAVNVLLFVPIGFCGLAAWTCDRIGVARKALAAAVVTLLSASLSVLLEFGQIWFPPRVGSKNDIIAESIGAVVGVALSLTVGGAVTACLRTFSSRCAPQRRYDWLLQAYFVGLCVYSLLPLDLTIRPAEVLEKYHEGKFQLVPFAAFHATLENCCGLAADMLLFLPVGMLVVPALTPPKRWLRFLGRSLFWGLATAVGIGFCQVFVYSRRSDITQLLLAAVGVFLGAVWRPRLIQLAAKTHLHP